MDFREIENRREAFIRWYAWSLEYKDCDPAVWLTNYLHRRYEHNREQRYWLAWLYGNTYNLDYIITNCSNNFGPYQNPEKLIPKIIINCIKKKKNSNLW